MKPFYISYSSRKTYKICPKQYDFKYILKPVVESDPRSSMFGISIGKILEWFYERRLWSLPNPTEACIALVEDSINYACKDKKFEPLSDPAFITTMRQDLYFFIPKSLEIIQKHGFLTVNSRAEVDLTTTYEHPIHGSLKLGGRCDFLHGNDRTQITILDGKASRHREKFMDSDQLIWYALLHYLKYHVAPVKLGFIFFKFPENPVQWIAYDESDMRKVVDDTFDVANKIQLKMFDPRPSDDCTLCDYKGLCEEGTKFLSKKRADANRIGSSIFDIESID